MGGLIRILDGVITFVLACGKWLALPVAVLLFLQWPLRDIISAYSREANDLGQLIFALYVACCVTAATRAGTHLSADALARHYSDKTRRILFRLGAAFGLIPWALFVLFSSRNMVLASIVGREAFPDTYNPGYFLIKLALWLLAMLMLLEGVIVLFKPAREA
jgi:TRAP-type mannitol/chloroaromatic compound transport system permease small subunit